MIYLAFGILCGVAVWAYLSPRRPGMNVWVGQDGTVVKFAPPGDITAPQATYNGGAPGSVISIGGTRSGGPL